MVTLLTKHPLLPVVKSTRAFISSSSVPKADVLTIARALSKIKSHHYPKWALNVPNDPVSSSVFLAL